MPGRFSSGFRHCNVFDSSSSLGRNPLASEGRKRPRRKSVNNSGPKVTVPFPTVGIGASAGAVPALQAFFAEMPPDTGAAYVVIVHLDPTHASELSGILAQRTSMPVQEVKRNVPLEPNKVYVIPPNRRILITNHDIATFAFDEPRGKRAPIDHFFRSLADQHGDGYAVILTGAGSDGVQFNGHLQRAYMQIRPV
jgi:two-component system CheB/CheR fusion protein